MNQTNKILLVIGSMILLVAVYVYLEMEKSNFDPKNATYLIEEIPTTLVDGRISAEVAPGSASTIEVSILGDFVKGDLNNDSKEDAVMILTFSGGGSGTFYYVVAAIREEETIGTNAILLGDRISPQNISIENNIITINYLERNSWDSFAVPPSFPVTKKFIVEGINLTEVMPEHSVGEKACMDSGGTVTTSMCCTSANSFPNTCLIGACGCSPDNSHRIQVCECGEDKCFDGEKCISIETQ